MSEKSRSFLFDRMLGKLCTTMRMLGYDSRLNPEGEEGRFLLNAANEGRVAVTRARSMRDRPGPRALVLDTEETVEQIVEIFTALGLSPRFEPFTRCLECNTLLVEESAGAVKGHIPPYVEKHSRHFHRCPECRRIYWEGSHFKAMSRKVKEIETRIRKK